MRKNILFLAMLTLAACNGVSQIQESPRDQIVTLPLVVSTDPLNAVPNPPSPATGIASPSTVTAGLSMTRTHLEGSSDGGARVLWNAGDSFTTFWVTADHSGYASAEFTTSGSGESATFTSPSSLQDGELYSFYPGVASGMGKTPDKALLFDLEIPSEQTAVPGGVADGVNLSFAASSIFTDELRFHNIPALVRFRLGGAVVSSVAKVTIKGTNQIAGHFVVSPSGDSMEKVTGWSFGGETSNSVTLSGTFSEGTEYYVAIVPSTQRISMVFSDGADGKTTKTSGKEIEFGMGRITDIGTIDLGSVFTDAKPIAPVLYNAASASGLKPVSIAVIPEGFTESQMDKYDILARSALEALFTTEPYKSYRNCFNAWILYAPSKDQGASVTDGSGEITELHHTAFGARWGAKGYGDMDADRNAVYEFVQENCPDVAGGQRTVDEVPTLMIINDSRYAGICHVTSVGRGFAMVPYVYDGESVIFSYPSVTAVSDSDPSAGIRYTTAEEFQEVGQCVGDWRNIVVHEFGGHCFGRLDDEYWSNDGSYLPEVSSISAHSWKVPFGLNVSVSYTDVPWQKEILDNLSDFILLDSRYSRIGVWQGAGTSPLNRWRSEKISCMIDNRFYFSTWQRALIVKRIMQLAGSSFDLYEFVGKDNPSDPVRDELSSGTPGAVRTSSLRVVPPLARPVLQVWKEDSHLCED